MNTILKSITISIVALLSSTLVFAADSPPPANSVTQKWFCLKPTNSGTHDSSLTVKDGVTYDTTKPTYVVVKVALDVGDTNPSADNSGMTAGSASLDTHIFNSTDGLNKLASKLGFTGGVSKGSNPTSSFPVEWSDDLSKTNGGEQARAHFWYGMQEEAPVPTTAAVQGNQGAQQQGTIDWVKSKGKGAADCEFISWDPFGYVFDATTHGPISGVYVQLLTSQTADGVYAPVPVGIGTGKVSANPVITNSDGSYKFYVDPGFYKLALIGDVTKSGKKYTIEKNINNIKNGFREYGYEQVYIAETPEVIQEVAGKVERRDIAIETIGAPAPFSINGPKIQEIMMHSALQNGEQMIRFSGRVQFIPVDLIAQYMDDNNTVVEEKKFSLAPGHKYVPLNSNNDRNFDIWVSASSTDGKGVLKNLKVTSKFSTKLQSMSVPPMPSYLDGIAFGITRAPVVNGTVGVYPMGSNIPVYTTSTDSVGHFVVTSEWIPPFSYELHYTTTAGDVIKVSTTDYLKQNEKYLKDHSIQSYSGVITDANGKPKNLKDDVSKVKPQNVPEPTSIESAQSFISRTPVIMMFVLVIMMLLMIGVGAFVVMKSKQNQLPPQMQ